MLFSNWLTGLKTSILRRNRRLPRSQRQGAHAQVGTDQQRTGRTIEPLDIRTMLSAVTVTTTNDVLDGTTTDIESLLANPGADGQVSLREAVQAANGGSGPDVILVPAGTYTLTLGSQNENAAAGGDLDLTDTSGSTTIIGAGTGTTVVDGNTNRRVFHVLNGVTANLRGLTVQNGFTVDDGTSPGNGRGAGILNDGGTLSLDFVSVENNNAFSQNEAAGQGGGIFSAGGALNIRNSTVDGNQIFADGGDNGQGENGGNAQGGGLFSTGGTALTITNSTISNNQATAGQGGRGGDSAVFPTMFNGFDGPNGGDGGDGGTAAGGGLYVDSGTVDITNATFSGNQAIGGAGGVGGNGGAGTTVNMTMFSTPGGSFISTTFTTASADGGDGGDGGNAGTGRGGGLFVNSGTVDLTHVTVANNRAVQAGSGAAGGMAGMGAGGGASGTAGTQGVGASADGGGLFVQGGTVALTSTLVDVNDLTGGGTGFSVNGTVTADTSLIEDSGGATINDGPNGGNIVDMPVGILALTDNGGVTETHAVTDSSLAVNAGLVAGAPTVDQRRMVRDSMPDIGAFEFAALAPVTFPEIAVLGNAVSITSGDMTPSTADGTDFGSVLVDGETAAQTFVITNFGDGALSLSGTPAVSVAGPDAADFTVTLQPAASVSADIGAVTFVITFDPSAEGTRTAMVSIDNDDADESPYTFDIQGNGFVPPPINVDIATDENDGVGVGAGTSLREAIIAANADPDPTTITIDASLNGTPIILSIAGTNENLSADGDLDILTPITIQGQGAANSTIDGGAIERVLQVQGSGDLTLDGVTITNGNAAGALFDGSGGAILNEGPLTITNSTITNNSAVGQGGGVFGLGSVTVSDSVISENVAGSGGATFTFGALTIQNSTVSGNMVTGQGGGLHVSGTSATVTNSTISGNTSTGNGGGIVAQPSGALTIANSTLSGNMSGNVGGGIYHTGGTLRVTNSTVAGNSQSFNGPGAAIYNYGAPATLNNSIISGSSPGGDLYSYDGFSGTNNLVEDGTDSGLTGTITGSALLGPLADNGGPTETHALLTGSPAIDAGSNTNATDDGTPTGTALATDQRGIGFDRIIAGTVDIGSFESVPPSTLTVSTTADENDGDFSNGDLSLREAIILANLVDDANTIVLGDGGYVISLSGTDEDAAADGDLDITSEITIQGVGVGITSINGGMIERVLHVTGTGNLTLEDVTVTAGSTTGDGGGVLIDAGGQATINTSDISENMTAGGSSAGGGLHNDGTVTISNSSVSYNMSSYRGGGISNTGTATITGSTIAANTAPEVGGLRNVGSGSVTLNNSTVSGNTGTSYGGGIGNYESATLTVTNSTITGNTTGDMVAGGAGIANAASATITNSILVGNNASTSPDGVGTFDSNGGNIVGDVGFSGGFVNDTVGVSASAVIESSLADNGGPTQTHALVDGSLAIDAGINANATDDGTPSGTPLATDQRGFTRIQGGTVDAGAVEVVLPDMFTVDIATDENDGVGVGAGTSLREAIIAANANPNQSTITIDASLNGTPIVLSIAGTGENASLTGDLDISSNVTITGNGASNSTIDANSIDRVLNVLPGGSLTVEGVTITGGTGGGAGIDIYAGGSLSVSNSTISGNSSGSSTGAAINNYGSATVSSSTISGNAGNYGAVYNSGSLSIVGSTISGNTADYTAGVLNRGTATIANSTISGNTANYAAGIGNYNGTLSVTNSTITGNTANYQAGLKRAGGTVTVNNSIIAGNTAGGDPDVAGTFTSNGTNIIGDVGGSSGFGSDITGVMASMVIDTTLADNGGPTATHALLFGSPAIDAGINANATDDGTPGGTALVTDQRGAGFDRVLFGIVDIGAVEADFSDYGDAPDTFATLAGDDGAQHLLTGPQLGALRDFETDGLPSVMADGDDNDNTDDEDGVTPVSPLFVSAFSDLTLSFEVDLVNPDAVSNRLDAWLDLDASGTFEAGEQFLTSFDLGTTAGPQVINAVVPSATSSGDKVARFRLSTAGGLAPNGRADDGEVEDYLLNFAAFTGDITLDLRSGGGDTEISVEGDDLVVRQGDAILFAADVAAMGSLTVNGSSDDDVIDVDAPLASDAADFSLTIDGGDGTDEINFLPGPIDIGGGTLDATAEDIAIGTDVTTTGDLIFNGPVVIPVNTTLAADNVTFNSTVDTGTAPSLLVAGGTSISEFDATGGPLGLLNTSLNTPIGLAVDADDNIYVAELGAGEIEKFDIDGNSLGTFASGLGNTRALGIAGNGNIFVVVEDAGEVRHFQPDGTALGVFASGLTTPNGIAFDSAGNVYVSEFGTGEIERYQSDGTPFGVFATVAASGPTGIAIDADDNLYVSEQVLGEVEKFDSAGNSLGTFATGLNQPIGIAFDENGTVYIGENGLGEVTAFQPDGTRIGRFASAGGVQYFAFSEDGDETARNLTINATGMTTFGDDVGSIRPLNALTTDAPGSTKTGGAISAAFVQINDNLILTADTTFTGTSSTFTGSINSASGETHALSLSGDAAFDGPVGDFDALSSLSVGGSSSFAGSTVTTTGTQTFSGAVILEEDTTFAGSTVSFVSTVDSESGETNALTVTGNADFGGLVGNMDLVSNVSVSGQTNISGGGIFGIGTQDFSGALILEEDTSLSGSTLTFGSTIDSESGETNELDIAGSANFDGAVGSTDNLSELSVTLETSISGGSIMTTGTQRFLGAVILEEDTALTGSTMTFESTVDSESGETNSLTITGNAGFNGTVGGTDNLSALSVSGTTNLGATARTTGDITFTDAVFLTADTTLNANAVTFGSTVDSASSVTEAFVVTFDAGDPAPFTLFDLDGSPLEDSEDDSFYAGVVAEDDRLLVVDQTQGILEFPFDSSPGLLIDSTPFTALGVATDAAGNIYVSLVDDGSIAVFADDGTFQNFLVPSGTLTNPVGLDVDSAGNVIVADPVDNIVRKFASDGTELAPLFLELPGAADVAVDAADNVFVTYSTVGVVGQFNSAGTFTGLPITGLSTPIGVTIDDDGNLHIAESGAGEIESFASDGTPLGTSITGLSDPFFVEVVTIVSPATPRSLTVNASGTTTFGGAVGGTDTLSTLMTDAGGATVISGDVTTDDTQTFNDAVILTEDTTFTGSTITFGSTVDSESGETNALTVMGNAEFGGAIGGNDALNFLLVSGASALNGGAITTSLNQQFSGAVLLGANTTLTGTNIEFDSTVDTDAESGTFSLTISGDLEADGAIGGNDALNFLLVSGESDLGGGSIETVLNQDFSGPVLLRADTTLTGTTIEFDSTVDTDGESGTFSLTINGDTEVDGAIGGSDPLSSLAVSGESDLGGGSIDTNGDQTFSGPVLLRADTTLTGTAVSFQSTVDSDDESGNFALTVNASGATSFDGVVGGSGELTTLTTDAAGMTTLSADVTSAGAQNFNDPVTIDGAYSPNGTGIGQPVVDNNLTFDSAATFNVDLNGATAGTEYDQIQITGAGRTVELGEATLTVDLGFGAIPGTEFIVLDLVEADSVVTNTFAGILEGDVVVISGTSFLVSYMGGDGNDVSLLAGDGDFGDAPTGGEPGELPDTYNTLLANDGAVHSIDENFRLGAALDAEFDGQPTGAGLGDDIDGDGDDEDGVIGLTTLVRTDEVATTSSVEIVAALDGRDGLLQGWIDFNRDGDWDDDGEQIFTDVALIEGSNILTFTIPAGAGVGDTFARFRLSETSGLGNGGFGGDGEVEDYLVALADGTDTPVDATIDPPEGVTDTELVLEDGNLVLRDTESGTVLFSAPQDSVDRVTITGTGGDDTLQVDPLALPPGGIFFDGGDQESATGDSIEVTPSSDVMFNIVEYTASDIDDLDPTRDGSIEYFLDDMSVGVIDYSDIEPIIDNSDAVDRIFTIDSEAFPGDHDILLTNDVMAGFNRIDSAGGPPFESVVFANPTRSLTINSGDGSNEITIEALDDGFNIPLFIDGESGSDALFVDGSSGDDFFEIRDLGDSLLIEAETSQTLTIIVDGVEDVSINASSGSDRFEVPTRLATADVANLTLNGGDDADLFNVRPSGSTAFFVNGDAPTTAPGDVLNYLGAEEATETGEGEGTIGNTTFTGIETQQTDDGLVVGQVPLSPNMVRIFDPLTGSETDQFTPYSPRFQGGVRTAQADVNGDGIADILTVPASFGGPHVRVFDGVTGGSLLNFFAFDRSGADAVRNGLFIAGGDVNDDGLDDIIVSQDSGGFSSEVRVFSGADGSELQSFSAYDPTFTGGVRVAAGDINSDGLADIITAPGSGTGQVRVFDGGTGAELDSFFAFDPSFSGGVSVAAGDVNDDGFVDILAAARTNGTTTIRGFDGRDSLQLFEFDSSLTGSVSISAGDVTGEGVPEIIASQAGRVEVFDSEGEGTTALSLSPTNGDFASGTAPAIEKINELPVSILEDQVALEDSLFSLDLDDFIIDPEDRGLGITLAVSGGGSLPGWLSFDSGSHVLSGTPLQADAGVMIDFDITVDDVRLQTSTSFTLDVQFVNDAPVVGAPIVDQIVNVGDLLTLGTAGAFSDEDDTVLMLSATLANGDALPGWLSFDGTTFTGTPAGSDAGTISVAVTASDDEMAMMSDTFNILVNTPPIVQVIIPDQNAIVDQPFNLDLLGTFADADADSLTLSVSAPPEPVNVSLNGTASQSTTLTTARGPAVAGLANDGNTDGNFFNDSVSITQNEADSFWQVDLGADFDLTEVVLYNRTDCCSDRLSNFRVSVLDDSAEVFGQNFFEGSGFAPAQFSVDLPDGTRGDTVRVQLQGLNNSGNGTLQLAEVEVFAELTLPDWLSFDGMTFTGTPASADMGSVPVTVTADDGNTGTVSDTFSINVIDQPVITPIDDQIAIVDSSFTLDATSNFTSPGTLTFSATLNDGSPLPAWLTFNMDTDDATADFDGTPTDQDTGTISVRVTATNGFGAVNDEFDIIVNTTPVVDATIDDQTVQVGDSLSLDVSGNFSDADSNLLTFSAELMGGGNLPAWLDFNPSTATFSGTPSLSDADSLSITVTVDDGLNGTASDTFDLLVNADPQITPLADQTAFVDQVFSLDASTAFSDPNSGQMLTFSAMNLPFGLTIDSMSGVINGATPTAGDAIPFGNLPISVDVTADDGNGGTATDTFLLDINTVPVITPTADQIVQANETFNLDLTSSFSDADNDPLDVTASLVGGGALPGWLSFDSQTLAFIGNPMDSDAGTISVKVDAVDNRNGTASDEFDILVNRAPVVSTPIADQTMDDSVIVGGDALNLDVSGNFSDPDMDSLTLTATQTDGSALPAWLNFDGTTFTGSPAQGDAGLISVRVTADDGNMASVTDDFDIDVNNAPTVQNPLADLIAASSVQVGDNVMINVPTNTFDDVDSDTLTITAELSNGDPLPAWLSFDGTNFTGTPMASDAGPLTINVIASDGRGGTATDTFDLNVNTAPAIANGGIADSTAFVDQSFSLDISSAFTDAESDTLTYTTSSSLPFGLTLDMNTGLLNGATPLSGDALPAVTLPGGLVSITVDANDGNGGTVSDTFLLDIDTTPQVDNAVPDQIDGNSAQIGSAFSFDIPMGTFSDADGDSLTLTAGPGPVNVALNGTATQSSTFNDGSGPAVASRANDGNTDGNFFNGSVSFTQPGLMNAFWQVALTQDFDLGQIVIYNRSGAQERLSNFRVSVLDDSSEVFGQNFFEGSGFAPDVLTVDLPPGTTGDTVRIQLLGDNNLGDGVLALAEVEVFPVVEAGPLANGLTLTGSTLSATSITGPAGTVAVGVTADDGRGGSVSTTFDLEINTPPTFDTPIADDVGTADVTAFVGQAFSLDVSGNFSDADSDALTFSTSDDTGPFSLSSGGSLNGASAMSGDAIAAGDPPLSISVTADDGNGGTVDGSFTLDIDTIPAEGEGIPDQTGVNGAQTGLPFSFDLPAEAFSDADGDTLTFTAEEEGEGSLPNGLTFDGSTFSADRISGPLGTATIEVTADDGRGGTFSLTFDLEILQGPVIAAAGAQAGEDPFVRVFDADGTLQFSFLAYDPSFQGGVNVALGDINDDGVPDIVTGPGAGIEPEVRVFDGNDGSLIDSFLAYNPLFTGGVFVATGDVDGDDTPDIITGAGVNGGPHVRAFDGSDVGESTPDLLANFFAYDRTFRGGVRVASADVNDDGFDDIITAPATGSAPVQILDGTSPGAGRTLGVVIDSLDPFGSSFTGGISVAGSDINRDGFAELIVGTASGASNVIVIDVNDSSTELFNFDADGTSGVSVGTADVNGDGVNDILTGQASAGSEVRSFDGTDASLLDEFFAFDPAFPTGISIAGNPVGNADQN